MKHLLAFFAAFTVTSLFAITSEISVDLKLDEGDYVIGERIRGVVNVANSSPDKIMVGYPGAEDRLIIEVFRAEDMRQMESVSKRVFVSPFFVASNEGQKLETFLGDHYVLKDFRRYMARPVLIHRGIRYEGQLRAFDVVPGMKIGGALQMFKNREGLRREFDLSVWSRRGKDHLFLLARDEGVSTRSYITTDLGEMMKITKPTVSIMPDGKVIVLHRIDPDNFLRSEFWSLLNALEFRKHELVQDPETAGQNRVRQLYKEAGGVEPKPHSWWKFWE